MKTNDPFEHAHHVDAASVGVIPRDLGGQHCDALIDLLTRQ
jgi:hypothetical protein